MARRRVDPRPPVEVWAEGEPPERDVQRVEVGGGRGRRGSMVALAALALLVVGGLLLGGGDDSSRDGASQDDDESSTTLPRSTSTTRQRPTTTSSTSTTAVLGPILPVQTGAAVLAWSDATGRWTWLDLDTGLLRPVEVRSDDAYSAVPVRGGVVVQQDGEAAFVPLPEGEQVELGPSDQVVSTGLPDAVWLVRIGTGRGLPGGSETTARLVGLDGEIRVTVAVPQLAYAAGATADGLVFTAGGRTYLAGAEGVRPLGVGDTLSVADPFVVLLACDERAECAPEVINTRTGRRRTLRGVSSPHPYSVSVIVSSAGEVAVAQHEDERGLSVYDTSGRIVGRSAGYLADVSVRWLPGGAGLVAAGRPLSIVRPDGAGGLVSQLIQGVRLSADLVLVIPG